MLATSSSPKFLSATLSSCFYEFLETILSVIVISFVVGGLVINTACCMAVIYGLILAGDINKKLQGCNFTELYLTIFQQLSFSTDVREVPGFTVTR